MMASELILGLDLSLTASGVALLRGHPDGSCEVLDAQAIKGADTGFERVRGIAAAILHKVRYGDGESPVVLAAIEGYSYSSKFQGQALGELGGAIKLILLQERVSWEEIPPAAWRKELLGRGNLPKDMVRLEAARRYRLENESLDALEATLVGMCAWRRRLGMVKPMAIRRRKEAV